MNTTRPRPDPYPSFNFVLELDGKPIAGFSDVSGLNLELRIVDHRDDSDARPGVPNLPGLRKVTNVTLKRGVANRKALHEWQASGSANRRAATVVLRDEAGHPVRRWQVAAASPSKVVGPSLRATGNDIAIESLELTHDGVQLED